MDKLLAGKLILPFGGGLLAIVLSSATRPEAGRKHSAEADHRSATIEKVIGFPAERVIDLHPEW
jgi:hypothetical protein